MVKFLSISGASSAEYQKVQKKHIARQQQQGCGNLRAAIGTAERSDFLLLCAGQAGALPAGAGIGRLLMGLPGGLSSGCYQERLAPDAAKY
jgi:hypothetical protein